LSIQVHCASRRPAQATNQTEQEALDVSGGIQDGYELALLDLQAKPLQDFYKTIVSGNSLTQVKNLQDGFGLLTVLFPDDIQDILIR
jgi:hypothetical protein